MRAWFRGVEVIEIATVLFVLAYYYIVAFRLKQYISPDMVAIAVLVAFLIRSRGLLKDWIAFFGLFIVYELLRNVIPDINTRVDWTLVDGLERVIFFGNYPVLWIQQHQNQYLSWLFFTVYIAHYFTILFPAIYLAFRDRWQFRGYITVIIVTSYLGFLIFLVFPVAPPRFALPGTEWITAKVFEEANILINGLNGNPYAAMPSLHFGLPWVAFLYLRRCSRLLGPLYGLITAIMAVGVVYLGDHYVLDVVGGILVGLVGYHISRYLTGDFWRRPPPVRWLGTRPELGARGK